MTPRELLSVLSVAERLKCATRHCYTSTGRHESVAEHSWRIALMAMLLTPEFPELDTNRVIRMCLIHDLGEAFTGDIPTFDKTAADTEREDRLLADWVAALPAGTREEFQDLLSEMDALRSTEAKLYKALDKLEAVISHNESDIGTWLPLEYSLQLTYGAENVSFSPYLTELRGLVNDWTRRKIAAAEIPEKAENR